LEHFVEGCQIGRKNHREGCRVPKANGEVQHNVGIRVLMLSRLETLETIHGDGACCHVHQETGDSHERWSSGFLLVTMCIQSASFKHSQNFVAKATTTRLVR
jgi:hypothetical protein